MILYVDTSALLRVVLHEAGGLDEIRDAEALVSSELIGVESSRTVDRLRLGRALSVAETATLGGVIATWLEAFDLVLLRPAVPARAGQPLPTPLGTVDAIHLASALLWRERRNQPLIILATHDDALALAARAYGFGVIGA